MNEQKAIEVLTLSDEAKRQLPMLAPVYEVAVQALEKQIPKKPLPYKPYEGKCPVCSVVFLSNLTCYCGNCGQRLDWREENEYDGKI